MFHNTPKSLNFRGALNVNRLRGGYGKLSTIGDRNGGKLSRTRHEARPEGLLSMLPKEFTREDVKALRIAQGMKPDPKMVISNWVKRGLVVRGESCGVYAKVVSSQ